MKKTEYLFNILMDYQIPFLTNRDKTLFILLDAKTVISSKKISEELLDVLKNKNFNVFERIEEVVEPSLLATVLMIPDIYIEYEKIIL